MNLRDLLNGVEITGSNVELNTEIKDVCYYSKECSEGSVFVCIKGYRTDGHRYIKDALKKGVAAIITDEPQGENIPHIVVNNTRRALAIASCNYFNHPSKKIKLIGVTGTNGKTSVTYMLKSILEANGEKVGLIGTNYNMIGEKIFPAERTTPESYDLQKLLHQMAQEQVSSVVMEVSSHALSLDRVYGCAFDVGIFTNLTQDHLDFHKTMEAYLRAKAMLFEMCTVGIVNGDDLASGYILRNATCKPFTYSIDRNDTNVIGKNLRMTPQKTDFEILYNQSIERIHLNIPGKFSVYNALAAITASLALGIPTEVIRKGIGTIVGVKGRVEVVEADVPFTIMIDYAHTPDGLSNVISAVRDFVRGRVITVVGCGGDRDRSKRRVMGSIAAELSDYVVVTSDNPRSENPQSIIRDILEGMPTTKRFYSVITDRKEAIFYALSMARAGDMVLLAGKGHETYQILKDETIHFDEREIIEEFLTKNRKN